MERTSWWLSFPCVGVLSVIISTLFCVLSFSTHTQICKTLFYFILFKKKCSQGSPVSPLLRLISFSTDGSVHYIWLIHASGSQRESCSAFARSHKKHTCPCTLRQLLNASCTSSVGGPKCACWKVADTGVETLHSFISIPTVCSERLAALVAESLRS